MFLAVVALDRARFRIVLWFIVTTGFWAKCFYDFGVGYFANFVSGNWAFVSSLSGRWVKVIHVDDGFVAVTVMLELYIRFLVGLDDDGGYEIRNVGVRGRKYSFIGHRCVDYYWKWVPVVGFPVVGLS